MRLNKLFSSVADAGRELLFKSQQVSETRSLQDYCEDLCSNRGEALGTALAREVVEAYDHASNDEKERFFFYLLDAHSADPDEVLNAAKAYKENGDFKAFKALNLAAESPRQNLFRRINLAPGAIKTLVQLRQDLLVAIRKHPTLKPIDFDLQHLFNSWFNRGFLTLEEIDWQTPANILEKLIQYEAVHAMDGWDDLKKRLDTNRRCYGFFHPSLPSEPLIFVEVALVNGIAGDIKPLIDPDESNDSRGIDTAIFYSISNCQQGLKGISFGNFLIKQVVMELKRELPQLKQYATLSPIPGFKKWLSKELADDNSECFSPESREALSLLDANDWINDPVQVERLESVLQPLCAHYLYHAKRGQGPLDPVANFHLGNGAYIQRLNWLADLSSNGLKQSAGMMVNYRYEIDRVEENHEGFINQGEICISPEFKKHLQ